MSKCCGSKIMNENLNELLSKCDMNAFNGDIVNILYCLKVIELMNNKEIADTVRKQIYHFLETDEVPNWENVR